MLTRRLCLGFSGAFLARAARAERVVLAATPISRLDLPWWRVRHQAVLGRLARGGVDLIFLGDSITQNWERQGPPEWMDFRPVWDRFYGDRRAVNLGFSGDTTASLLWRIENGELDGIAPKVAVILIGANNLGRVHWSAADSVVGIMTILAAVRRRLPRTKILLLGVLPSERSPWATETTSLINAELARRIGRAGPVTFLDGARVFMREGRLDRNMFYDPRLVPPEAPLHPTAQAQARLAAFIEPDLARLFGDHDHR